MDRLRTDHNLCMWNQIRVHFFFHNKRTSKRGNQVQRLHIERQCPSNRSLNHPCPGAKRINHSLSKKRATSAMSAPFSNSRRNALFAIKSDPGIPFVLGRPLPNMGKTSIEWYLHCIMKTTQTNRIRRREILISHICFRHPNLCHYPYHRLLPRVVMSS